jgi:mannose-1-phosphate guanylyltransferase/mannose-1-phosphate guanylyltransferase/mannose-6-phosphate isomerase
MTIEGPITPVLLCGGAGTRLWPLSRAGRPKQLLALAGAETMLQQTAARVPEDEGFAPPVVVAGADQAAEIEAQLSAAGLPLGSLIVEPAGRNTAPAIALAALAAAPDELLLVMPSDHVIEDAQGFRAGVARGASAAREGRLVTFGIRPVRPETGYGYIKVGGPLGEGVAEAEAFVEKPDMARAETFLADGGYAWNAGIFLFRADAFLEALRLHAPQVLEAASAAMDGLEKGVRIAPRAAAFAASPSISVDHAVMEKAERIAVVPLDIGWSDVGSWEALHALSETDARGNSADEKAILIDSSGCLVRSEGPTVVAIGVEDLVVVATRDHVLIVPRSQSQRVREAVAAIERREAARCAG